MGGDETRSAYRAGLTARLRRLREAKGWTQAQMAVALGIPEERYRKYEGRSWLPIYLLEQLSLVTGRSIHFIVTGRDLKEGRVLRVPKARRSSLHVGN